MSVYEGLQHDRLHIRTPCLFGHSIGWLLFYTNDCP